MTTALIIGALIMAVAAILFALSLAKAAARGDRLMRRAHIDYQMRYVVGDALCSACGKPTVYSLRGRPTHPHCRTDAA